MSFDWEDYNNFTSELWIDTKEFGSVKLGTHRLSTQKRLIREMKRGMENGYHDFITLKSRQVGISTETLALDMYYAFRFAGSRGAIVLHTDKALDLFRSTLETYYAGLPDDWKVEQIQHNRNQWFLANRSIIQYMVAGETMRAGSLGRSSAIVFGHMTEVAFYGDPNQVDSLRATMAKRNPNRFYHWESTANGHNFFQDMWVTAQESATMWPIFIGWWANDLYRVERDSKEYQMYWGAKGRMTKDERDWYNRLLQDYDFDLTPEHLAWYRCYRAEQATSDEMMLQEFPTTPEEAFQSTASKFFRAGELTKSYNRCAKEEKPKCYHMYFGAEFTETIAEECREKGAHLKVWEEPVKGGFYTLGADPAYGSSVDADRYVIEVHRCWANREEQVAEFCVTELRTDQFAWVIAYLAGCYQPCVLNVEFNGPGGAVLMELDKLKKRAGKSWIPGQAKTMMDIMRNIQAYYYVREDAVSQKSRSMHTITTSRIKDAYMSAYRDAFERGIYVLHSRDLIDEMSTITREGTEIRGEGTAKDDRVVASALAHKAYYDQMISRLIMQNVVWKPPEASQQPDRSPTIIERHVARYLEQIGIKHRPKLESAGVKAYNLPPQRPGIGRTL
jgi:hypothetical protein